MGATAQIVQAAGPWATLIAVLMAFSWLIARGKLVPKSTVDQRLADKQQIVDFHSKTTERLIEAIEEREKNVEVLIKQMSTLAATLNGGK
jgi:hypothetical protein